MKILKTLGNLGAVMLLFGAIFKIMHYPFASILIIFGSLFVFLYLLMTLSESVKAASSSKEKTFLIFLTITVLIQVVFALFKVMHWPGSNMPFIKVLIPLNILLTVVYLMYIMSETDESKKSHNIKFLVVYLTLSSYILLRWNSLPAHILNGFSFPDQSINNVTEKMVLKNAMLYSKLESDSLNKNNAQKIKDMANELTQYISDLKIEIIKAANSDEQELDFSKEITIYNLYCRGNYDAASFIMLGADGGANAGKAAELKGKINNYRDGLTSSFEGESKSYIDNGIGLKTDTTIEEDGETFNWEQCNFDHKPVASVIMVLDQLKNEVRFAESVALQHMMMK